MILSKAIHRASRAVPNGSRRSAPAPGARPARFAFTIIELLVVITIISILTGIVFVALNGSLTGARIESTKATIAQLDAALQQRTQSFNRIDFRSQAHHFIGQYDTAGNAAPNPPGMGSPLIDAQKVAELMIKKDRFRAAFPQRLEDLWGFDGSAAGTADNAPLWTVWIRRHREQAARRTGGPLPTNLPTNADPRPANFHRADLENSELLVLALTDGAVFGPPTLSLDSLNPKHVRDTAVDWNDDGTVTDELYPTGDDLDGDGTADGNGIPEIYDEWNQPIRFYNAPTRLIRPGDLGGADYTNINGTFLRITAGSLMSEVTAPPGTINSWAYANPLNQDPDDPTGALGIARDGEDFSTQPPNGTLDDPPEDINNDGFLQRPNYFHPDNGGFLLNYGFPSTAAATGCAPLDETFFHTLNTYHRPLIMSSGPDQRPGMFEPTGHDSRDPLAPPVPALRHGRVFAEDINLNNSLDSSSPFDEDLNGNGLLDQAEVLDQLYDNITN